NCASSCMGTTLTKVSLFPRCNRGAPIRLNGVVRPSFLQAHNSPNTILLREDDPRFFKCGFFSPVSGAPLQAPSAAPNRYTVGLETPDVAANFSYDQPGGACRYVLHRRRC